MFGNRPWILYTGIGLIGILVAGAVWPIPILRDSLVVAAGIAFAGAAVHLVGARSRSQYDLGALRKVHERAELDEIELHEPTNYDSVQCVCGETYASSLPVCPRCRRSQF